LYTADMTAAGAHTEQALQLNSSWLKVDLFLICRCIGLQVIQLFTNN